MVLHSEGSRGLKQIKEWQLNNCLWQGSLLICVKFMIRYSEWIYRVVRLAISILPGKVRDFIGVKQCF